MKIIEKGNPEKIREITNKMVLKLSKSSYPYYTFSPDNIPYKRARMIKYAKMRYNRISDRVAYGLIAGCLFGSHESIKMYGLYSQYEEDGDPFQHHTMWRLSFCQGRYLDPVEEIGCCHLPKGLEVFATRVKTWSKKIRFDPKQVERFVAKKFRYAKPIAVSITHNPFSWNPEPNTCLIFAGNQLVQVLIIEYALVGKPGYKFYRTWGDTYVLTEKEREKRLKENPYSRYEETKYIKKRRNEKC